MADITKPQTVPTYAIRIPHAALRIRQVWAARGIWLGAAAWLLALAGLGLLPAEPGRTWGMGLEVGAGVLAVLAWGRQRLIRGLPAAGAGERLVVLDRERVLRLAGIVVAGGLVWAADRQWIAQPNEPFGLAGGLWLASMILLIAVTAGWPERKPSAPTDTALPPGPSSLPVRRRGGATPQTAGTPLHTSLPVRRARPTTTEATPQAASRKPQAAKAPAWPMTAAPWTGWEIGLFAGLIVLAVVLRVWDLQDYPFAIHGDEILTGRNAIQYYVSGSPVSIFSTVWPPDINLPALWFLGVAIPLKLGGTWLAMLRLPAALFGAATVIPFYGLVREAWGRAAALGGTAILAVSASQVASSRVTLNNIVTPFFWALCCWFLLRGLRRRRPVDWVLAGLAGGLGEYSYYGTRLLIFVLAGFIAYLLVVHWRQGWRYLGHIGLGVLGYLAGFGPLLAYFLTNPGVYFGRGQAALIWNHIPRDGADFQAMWNILWPRMAENLLGFSTHVDQDSVYWGMFLLAGEAALLVLGTALLIRHWRRPAAFLMLLVGGGALFVGGTLLGGVPFFLHWTPGFPAIYATLAAPIGAWAGSWRQPFTLSLLRWRALGPALIAGLLLLGGVININYYFNQYHIERPEFDLRAAQARFVGALGPDTVVREVGWTWQPYDAETDSYLVHGQDGATLLNPASQLPIPVPPGKGLAFLFFDDEQQYRTVVGEIYPGGTWGEVFSTNKTHLFYTYVLTAQQMASRGGAQLQVWDEGRAAPRWTGPVATVGQVPAAAGGYPLRARWSGALYLAAGQAYQLTLADGPGMLLLDGQPAPLALAQPLLPGWHRFVIETHLTGPTPLQLLVGSAGAPPTEVPREQLWPEAPGAGLLGVLPGNSAPVLARVDPFIGFGAAGDPNQIGPGQGGQLPARVRWTGQLLAPQTGAYTLEIRTGGSARLLIDGQPGAIACSSGDPVNATTPYTLSQGPHALELDYLAGPAQQFLELYWTPPGGERQLVPPSALRYMAPTDGSAPPLPAPLTTNPCGG